MGPWSEVDGRLALSNADYRRQYEVRASMTVIAERNRRIRLLIYERIGHGSVPEMYFITNPVAYRHG